MNKTIKKIKGKINKENLPFLTIFLLYTFLFLFLPIIADDATLMGSYANLTWKDHWDLIVYDYYKWSSRVLVNFVIHFFLGKGKYVWILLNSSICVLLCKALSELFVQRKKTICNWFIVCMVLLYPIAHLGSAGWMITYMTYFWPMTFGFIALIPIKKIYAKESFKKWEYIFYSFSLIYAANEELELVVLLGCYAVFFVYYMFNKTYNKYFFVQCLLCLASLIFTLTCPGNGTRSTSEIINWFPNYQMLSVFDKIDLGLTTTMQELMYGNYIFVIAVCFIMFYVTQKKYKSIFIKIIPLVPLAICTLFGPLKNIVFILFDKLDFLTVGVSETGLLTISHSGILTMGRFVMMFIFIIMVLFSIFLCLEDIYSVLFSMSILLFGAMARCAMGFSPTIYASGFRTATPMWFGIIAIGIFIFSSAIKERLLSDKEVKLIMCTYGVIAILSYINAGLIVNG